MKEFFRKFFSLMLTGLIVVLLISSILSLSLFIDKGSWSPMRASDVEYFNGFTSDDLVFKINDLAFDDLVLFGQLSKCDNDSVYVVVTVVYGDGEMPLEMYVLYTLVGRPAYAFAIELSEPSSVVILVSNIVNNTAELVFTVACGVGFS